MAGIGVKSVDKDNTDKDCVKPLDKKYNKKTCCIYCKQLVFKLPRHLTRNHKDEEQVKLFNSYPPNSTKRLEIIEHLRKRGNFLHNYNALENKEGNIIVKRLPKKNKKISDFLPCPNCLAYYSKRTLSIHTKKCEENKEKWLGSQSRGRALLPADNTASNLLKTQILPNLRNDEIGNLIRHDKLILLFGSDLATKFCRDEHLSYHVRQRMRELGRLLLNIKSIDSSITSLDSVFDPKYSHIVLQAIQNLAEFSEEDGKCSKPSTVIKIRSSLTSCADILKNRAIQSDNDNERKKIQDFVSVFRFKLKRLCSIANQTLESGKWNNPTELPSTSDITKFNEYLELEQSSLYKKLQRQFSYDTWSKLSKVILVKIIVFNRRRVGEAQMLKVSDFKQRHRITEQSDMYKSLTETEKNIANNYYRIQVRGKHRRGVPILITRKEVEIIKYLIKYRNAAGIPEMNKYVFGRGNKSFLRATDAIRVLSSKAGLENSAAIRSIKLRKQIASQAQLLNLKENELDDLAGSLGHDIRVHRSYYRLPDHAIQIAKTGKILLAANQGVLINNKGKGLDDITINTESGAEHKIDSSIKHKSNAASLENITEYTRNISDVALDDSSVSLQYKGNTSDDSSDVSESKNIVKMTSKCLTPAIKKQYSQVNSKITGQLREETLKQESALKSQNWKEIETEKKIPETVTNQGNTSDDSSDVSESKNIVKMKSKCLTPAIKKQYSQVNSKITGPLREETLKQKSALKSQNWKEIETKKKIPETVTSQGNISDDSLDAMETKDIPKKKSRWLTPEKLAIKKNFPDFLLNRKVPRKDECEYVISKVSPLKGRSWREVKNWIHNKNKTENHRDSKIEHVKRKIL